MAILTLLMPVMLEALGSLAKHPCCQRLDCTETRDLTNRDSIPGNPKQDLLDLGCTVLSIKSTRRKSERKIRTSLCDVYCLLCGRFSQSQETGERRLTCWQHFFPYILILHIHRLDLETLLFAYEQKKVCVHLIMA